MTGGGFRIVQDVPPYILTGNEPLKYAGLNIIGLRRRGFAADDITILKQAFAILYDKAYNVSQAREKISAEFGANKYVQSVLEFLKESKRGIIGK